MKILYILLISFLVINLKADDDLECYICDDCENVKDKTVKKCSEELATTTTESSSTQSTTSTETSPTSDSTESTKTSPTSDSTESTKTSTSESTESTKTSTSESTESTKTSSTPESTESTKTSSTAESTESTKTSSTAESTESTKTSTSQSTESTETSTSQSTESTETVATAESTQPTNDENEEDENSVKLKKNFNTIPQVYRIQRNLLPDASGARRRLLSVVNNFANEKKYTCYTAKYKDNDKTKEKRGCLSLAEADENKCKAELKEIVNKDIDNCKLCKENKCNSAISIGVSVGMILGMFTISNFLTR